MESVYLGNSHKFNVNKLAKIWLEISHKFYIHKVENF